MKKLRPTSPCLRTCAIGARSSATHTRAHAKLLSALALMLATSLLATTPAFATDTSNRTNAEVRAEWARLKPTYTGAPFSAAPKVTTPHAPGALNAGYAADALGTINFARYLTGLPANVTIDPTLAETSQYGAVLLAAVGRDGFSHTPAQPSGMAAAFYERGYSSTSRSNIGWSSSTAYTAVQFQKMCLADADSGNVSRLGHRRWLLNPQMAKTGIGYAQASGGFFTTYAFDTSRSGAVDYDYIAWPSAGPFPVEFMAANTPWSITLNPAKYRWDAGGHKVALTRVADGRRWNFDASDTAAAGSRFEAEYFSADFGGYGVANAFIFRPDPSIGYAEGDEFEVTLSGGIYDKATGQPTSVSYQTRVMSLAGTGEPAPPKGPAPVRVSGSDRFATATAIAQRTFPQWRGVTDVVLASGDDRSACDPLAASGLCWAYDAPMLLTSAKKTPQSTLDALSQIVAANGKITLRVVGGTGALPDARIAEIRARVGASNVVVDRVAHAGDRYDLAAAIARRMKQAADANPSDDKLAPTAVLVANGAENARFFDALALSPVSAARGIPILLVRADVVPAATHAAIADLGSPKMRVVAGGTVAVSERVRTSLGAERWAGASRYETARAVAQQAVARGWLDAGSVGVAAGLPDALTGGSFVGRDGGVLLLTSPSGLVPATRSWLAANSASLSDAYVFGGSAAICDSALGEMRAALR